MTIEEFQKLMVRQQEVIKECLEKARQKLLEATNEEALNDDVRLVDSASQNVAMFDMKLDLMNWIVKRANEIEVPKTKMREFL